MFFRLIGIGGSLPTETAMVLHAASLQEARDSAAQMLRDQPDLEGVEIFDLVRFIEVVEPDGRAATASNDPE